MSRASIRGRLEKATPGPWRWGGNVDNREVYLSTTHSGRIFVMRFVRWGMLGAKPTFQNPDPDGWGTVDADALVVREQPYRGDIATIAHPDADLIAHAPTDLAALLAVADAAEVLSRGNAGDTMCCLLAVASDGLRHGDCAWDDLRAALAALEARP